MNRISVSLLYEVWIATAKLGQLSKWSLLASDALHFLVFCREIKDNAALLSHIMYLRENGGIKFVGGEKHGGLVIRELLPSEGGTWMEGEYDERKTCLSQFTEEIQKALFETERIVGKAPKYLPDVKRLMCAFASTAIPA